MKNKNYMLDQQNKTIETLKSQLTLLLQECKNKDETIKELQKSVDWLQRKIDSFTE